MRQLMKFMTALALLLTAAVGAGAQTIIVAGNGSGNWLNGQAWDVSTNEMANADGIYSITYKNVDAGEYMFKFVIDYSWYGCDGSIALNTTLTADGDENITFNLTETADVTISLKYPDMTFMISTSGMVVGEDADPNADPTVNWTATTNTATFKMPAGNVELTVEYYPVATATTDPVAAEDIVIESTDALVSTGTADGGTMKYAVTLTDEAPTTTNGFTATIPTATKIAEPATLYVWYYVEGDAEHSDSEIAGPLTVQVLKDKYDIAFQAANALTIAQGKATVTVGGEPATVADDGMLKDVKVGQTVVLTAKDGYKFKTVSAEKTAAGPTTALGAALVNGATLEVMCQSSNSVQMGGNFTYNGGVFTRNNFVGTSDFFSMMKATATVSGSTITIATGFTTNGNYDHNVTLNTSDDTYTLTGVSLKGSVVSVKVNGEEILDKLTAQ